MEKGWRPLSEIDGNVPDAAGSTADELHFGVRSSLCVQAPNSAYRIRPGMIDLDDAAIADCRSKLTLTVQARKLAPMVGNRCCVCNKYSSERSWSNVHASIHGAWATRADATYSPI
jgi:hypothetical protein